MDGVLVHEFASSLRLNMKRNEPRLRELEVRFGMKRTAVNEARAGAAAVGLARPSASFGGGVRDALGRPTPQGPHPPALWLPACEPPFRALPRAGQREGRSAPSAPTCRPPGRR